MLISFCVPCGNRAHDLKYTLPYMISAVMASSPAEIVVLDYGSTDDLEEYMQNVLAAPKAEGVSLKFHQYHGRKTYHQAHAYNLAVKSSIGEVIVVLGADAYPAEHYLVEVRRLIADGAVWGHARELKGILFCRRDEFLEAGGYDERFEFYGPEDRDLEERLARRATKFGLVPSGLMRVRQTPAHMKISNYRLALSKPEMSRLMRPIYEENRKQGVTVANQGQEWGSVA